MGVEHKVFFCGEGGIGRGRGNEENSAKHRKELPGNWHLEVCICLGRPEAEKFFSREEEGGQSEK